MAELLAAPIPRLGVYHVAVAKPRREVEYAACLPRHRLDLDRDGMRATLVPYAKRCGRSGCARRFDEADREADG